MIFTNFIRFLREKFFASEQGDTLQTQLDEPSETLVAAQEIAAVAEQEFGYGKEASDISAVKDEEVFAAIACWHYERCSQKYRLAAAKIVEVAAGLPFARNRHLLEDKARLMMNRADYAESLVRRPANNLQNSAASLSDGLKISANQIAVHLNSRDGIRLSQTF